MKSCELQVIIQEVCLWRSEVLIAKTPFKDWDLNTRRGIDISLQHHRNESQGMSWIQVVTGEIVAEKIPHGLIWEPSGQ